MVYESPSATYLIFLSGACAMEIKVIKHEIQR
jgi:hypothetical protein